MADGDGSDEKVPKKTKIGGRITPAPGGLRFRSPNSALSSRPGRLPSFKGQRDLTLTGGASAPGSSSSGGARPKANSSGPSGSDKKFVPNLNVTRNKKTDNLAAKSSQKSGVASSSHNASGKKSKEGPGGINVRKDLNKKEKPALIQTMGSVFGEGISADGLKKKPFGGGGGGRGDASEELQRPVIKRGSSSTTAGKFDKAAEEKRLKALLQDDFISDLSSDGSLVPVQLPMIDTGKVFKEEEEGEEEKRKSKGVIIRKKPSRVLDSDDDEDDPDPVSETDKTVINQADNCKFEKEIDFAEILRERMGDLVFLQLPDHLPFKKPQVKKEPKAEPGTTAKSTSDDTSKGNSSSTDEKVLSAAERLAQKCTLKDLPEGYLGKIQILKSGRTVLRIGETLMDLEMGTQVGFLQDAVAIERPQQPPNADEGSYTVGDMTVLGHVKHRAVVTPDWDALFRQGDEDSTSDEEVDGTHDS